MKRGGRRTQDWGADSGVETKKRGPAEEKLHHHPLLVSRKKYEMAWLSVQNRNSQETSICFPALQSQTPLPYPLVSLYFYFSLASRSLSKSNSHTENFFAVMLFSNLFFRFDPHQLDHVHLGIEPSTAPSGPRVLGLIHSPSIPPQTSSLVWIHPIWLNTGVSTGIPPFMVSERIFRRKTWETDM